MSTESITLLLANYNNGQYLRACLDSVLAQTSDRWRCIVLDDASTDDSAEVYAEYEGEPRIRIEHNPENLGYIGTLQRLIAMAETDSGHASRAMTQSSASTVLLTAAC